MNRADTREPGLVPGRTPVRLGPLSGVRRPRLVVVTLVTLVLAVAVAAVDVGRGDYQIALPEVLRALLGGGSGAVRFVVVDLRLPRTLTGLLVGAALGVAGSITQSIARNPLASPDMLGVTDGAGAAAVLAIVLGGSGLTVAGLAVAVPTAALAGGLGAAALVYGLAYRRGLDGYRLVLVGIGVTTAATSLTSWLLVMAQVEQAGQVLVWLRGSLSDRSWSDVTPVALALVVLLPAALLLSFRLGALQLDDDAARGLGVSLNRSRTALLVVAVLLAAAATACAGPIRFVALVVPRVAVRLTGSAGPPLLTSAVLGALLTVTADLIARTVLGDEQPVGIVTVVLGAPYLLYLLVRRTRGARA